MTNYDAYCSADTNLPETIKFDMQPYGMMVLGDLKLGSYNGYPTLEGTVLDGHETSYLFGHTSTRSNKGAHRTVYGIKAYEIEKGEIIRIAM